MFNGSNLGLSNLDEIHLVTEALVYYVKQLSKYGHSLKDLYPRSRHQQSLQTTRHLSRTRERR